MMNASRSILRIAAIPGDGIGVEVVDAAITVIKHAADKHGDFDIKIIHFPWGTAYYKQYGTYLPSDYKLQLQDCDAILFGAVGMPDVPDHESLWGLLLELRFDMQLFANVRPVKCLTIPCIANTAASDIDWMFIRENSEGEYAGHGGRSHRGQDWEVATETSVYTRHGVRRIMQLAFETANSRPKKHLTVVSKSNALRYGHVMWEEIAAETAVRFPEVEWETELVDAMTARMVQKPTTIDTVVGTNLQIDIISDLAAALAGSLGIASSANLDPSRQCPSLFEPVHGSAFDIMGKGISNPIGCICAAADMLTWLGQSRSGEAIMKAISLACENKLVTRDMGGELNTKEAAEFVCGFIA